MIGRWLWWLVCRLYEVPSITAEKLDAVDAAIREEAAK